jgi:hypothetical protein
MPADIAQPCDPVRVASPAFESAPLAVNILGGVQTNLPEVPLDSYPFLLDGYSPAQDTSVTPPVQFAFTVVDAVTNINPSSVAVDVTFNVPTAEPPSFRPVTKRVLISLDPCDDDDTGDTCSPNGNLDLAGFKAAGTAPELPVGPVEARIVAENLGLPPRSMDLRYSFDVLPSLTATATVTPTPEGGAASTAADESAGVAAGETGSTAPAADQSTTQSLAPHGNNRPASTPTATPSPGGAE